MIVTLALKASPLKALTGSWKRGRRARRRGHRLTERCAGMALSDIDIERAENWSRGLATLAVHWRNVELSFSSAAEDSSLLAFDFVGVHHGDM